MACVFLPCDCESWLEDKKFFLLLSHLRSVEELGQLISNHNREGSKKTRISTLLENLSGLHSFLANYCSVEGQKTFLSKTLPSIAKAASCLEERVPDSGVPFLVKQEASALVLGHKLVISLIANAFLCTFPSKTVGDTRPFNFTRFFNIFLQSDEGRQKTQAAKLKCILCYFERVADKRCDLQGVITLRRQVIPTGDLPSMTEWLGSRYSLCPLSVDNSRGIEDAGSHTLQVDFAGSHIGGGVLRGGRVQEEIRFCLCPEMLVSRLVMDRMENNEAIVITGMERFSYCKGYGYTLEFGGEYTDVSERDVFGNLLTSVVAIDALPFSGGQYKPEDQYQEALLLREMNKAYAGFLCQQQRGDISTELLALRAKRSSIALLEENYTDSPPPPRGGDALGNVNIRAESAYPSHILLPTSLLTVSAPLSPIREVSESPRTSMDESQLRKIADITKVTSSLVSSIIQSGVQLAMGKEGMVVKQEEKDQKREDREVAQFASTLTSSLFEDVTPKQAPAAEKVVKQEEKDQKREDREVAQFASTLTSSLFEDVTPKQAPAAEKVVKQEEKDQKREDREVAQFASTLTSSLFEDVTPKQAPAAEKVVKQEEKDQKREDREVAQFASTLTSSLFEDVTPKQAPAAEKVVKQEEKDQKREDREVAQFASTLTSSLFEDVTPKQAPAAEKVVKQEEKDQKREDQEVAQFASTLTSSLFEDVTPKQAPAAEKVVKQEEKDQKREDREVAQFASTLTSSLFEDVTPKQAPAADTATSGKPATESFASSLVDSLFQSFLSSADRQSADASEGITFETKAEEMVKSIFSDILSEVTSPSCPPHSPPRTVGQPTNTSTQISSLANQLAVSIISDAIASQRQPHLDSSPRPTRPMILVQTESRGSGESPRSSRSSSLTGQSLTFHEFTDDLVESSLKEGISDSITALLNQMETASTTSTEKELEFEELTEEIAARSIQDGLQQAKATSHQMPPPSERSRVKPKKAKGAASPGKLFKPSFIRQGIANATRKRPSLSNEQDASSDAGSEVYLNPALLSTPSSRMSYAWSMASTRDDDSRPVSPTDMDRIALGLMTTMEDYANLFAEIVIRDSVAEVTGSKTLPSPRVRGEEERGTAPLETNLPSDSRPGQSRLDTFLKTLDQAEPLSEDDMDTITTMTTCTTHWHIMQRALLRPVATGNWGCGAFKGNPQLKAMLQWLAVSVSGRPRMVYFPFNDERVKQLEAVGAHLLSKRWTAGQLCQAILDYCQRDSSQREKQDLFTVLLNL